MGPDDSESFEQTGSTVADETPDQVVEVVPDPAELIRFKHPALGGDEVATTTREAFDKLWADKGWAIVADDGTELSPAARGVVLVDQPGAVLKDLALTGQSLTSKQQAQAQQEAGNTESDTGATK